MEEKQTSKSKFSSAMILECPNNPFHLPCPFIGTFHLCGLYGKLLFFIVHSIVFRRLEGFRVSKCFVFNSFRFQIFDLQLRQLGNLPAAVT